MSSAHALQVSAEPAPSIAQTAPVQERLSSEPKRAFLTKRSNDLLFPPSALLGEIARSRGGDLRTASFAALLLALHREKRTCVVEVRRRHLRKRILIENGVPVECRSNVLHDTFAYYLRESGHLSGDQYSSCTKEALKRGVPVGEVLMSRGLLTSEQILSLLQKLLAKVLLDLFAWADGSFLIVDQQAEVQAPLKVRVDQLVLTGLSRFTPQTTIDQAISLLGDRTIAGYAEGDSRYGADRETTLRLGRVDREVLPALRREALSLEELKTRLPFDAAAIHRSVYALAQLGLIDLPEQVEEHSHREPAEASENAEPAAAPRGMDRDEFSRIYLDHRRMTPFQLLGLAPNDPVEAAERAYLELTQTIGKWSSGADDRTAGQARELLLAVAKAYGEISDPGRSAVPAPGAKTIDAPAEPERMELLDPTEHYTQGLEQMESGDYGTALSNLEIASDSDPQRGLYRAQAAYCLFLKSTDNAESALEVLVETHRLDPTCGLAFLYAGEVLAALERFEEAESSLRTASKLMAPDRRPIEKLRELRQLERAQA